ncbi:MAG: hypothetical protein ACTMIA_03490 [Vibrio sp.]
MMKTHVLLRTALLIITGVLTSVAPTVAANLSPQVAVKALKAKKLADKERYEQAIDILLPLPKRGYDHAYMARMLGIFYWQNEQIKPAIKALTLAVDSEDLEPQSMWSTRHMLADVLLTDKQYEKALKQYYLLAQRLPKHHKADQIWLRISQIHYQLSQWRKTLTGVQHYEQLGMPDAVQPLSLKVGAQLQLSQWRSAIGTLKRLLILEPDKKQWWMQLVNLEMRIKHNADALDSLALARLQGIEFEQHDIQLLAQLYAQNGIPERAAQVMSTIKGLANDTELLVTQAQYWQRAKAWDKAIDTWQLAAQRDKKYRWQVAQLMLQQGQYQSVLAVLDKIDDPQLKAEIALARTRALYQLHRVDHALKQAYYANRVQPSAEAKSWIRYLKHLQRLSQRQTS